MMSPGTHCKRPSSPTRTICFPFFSPLDRPPHSLPSPNLQAHMLEIHFLGSESAPAVQTWGDQRCQKQQHPDTQHHGLKAYEQGLRTEEQSCRHRSDCYCLCSVPSLLTDTGSLSTLSFLSLQLLGGGGCCRRSAVCRVHWT